MILLQKVYENINKQPERHKINKKKPLTFTWNLENGFCLQLRRNVYVVKLCYLQRHNK